MQQKKIHGNIQGLRKHMMFKDVITAASFGSIFCSSLEKKSCTLENLQLMIKDQDSFLRIVPEHIT